MIEGRKNNGARIGIFEMKQPRTGGGSSGKKEEKKIVCIKTTDASSLNMHINLSECAFYYMALFL